MIAIPERITSDDCPFSRSPNDLALARRGLAGLLYLVIIVAGLGAELGLRGPLIDLGDADATAAAILAAPGQFRLAIAADLVMALSDAGLAILLYLIFRAMAPGLALSAMVFRLIQTVLIAASLMALLTAWLVLTRADALSTPRRSRWYSSICTRMATISGLCSSA